MNQEKEKFKYVPALNGIRGLAVCGVMVYHAGDYTYLKGGFIFVDVFFVLSGFLITSLLLREHDNFGKVSLKKFYIRRTLRLLPPLLVMLTALIIFGAFTFDREQMIITLEDSLIVLFYAANWTRALGMERPMLIGHAWSLSIEEQFYIIWPFVLILLFRFVKSRKLITLIIITGALLSWALRATLLNYGSSPMRLYNGLDTKADTLFIGCALAFILYNRIFLSFLSTWKSIAFVSTMFSVASIIGLFFLGATTVWDDPNVYKWFFSAVNLMSAFLIADVVCFEKGLVSRLLELKLLVWLGSISYGLYLWHYPIFETMKYKYHYSKLETLMLGSLVTLVAASASYYLLEKPLLRFKKKFQVIATSNS